MALIYYPLDSVVLRRNTDVGGFEQTVISNQPNSIIVFDTGSGVNILSSSMFSITSSWAMTSSYSLNGVEANNVFSGSWSGSNAETLSSSYDLSKIINNNIILSDLVNTFPSVNYTTTINTSSFSNFNSSIFSGWGQYIGNISQSFNTVQFYIVPFNTSYVTTGIRCRLRNMPIDHAEWSTNPSTWEVVGDTTVYDDGKISINSPKLITANFGELKRYSGNLFFEFFTDGKTGIRTNLTTSLNAPPNVYYTIGSTLNSSQTWVAVSDAANQNFYCRLGLSNPTSFSTQSIASDYFKSQMISPVDIILPPNLYALEGRELNVYYDNVINANTSLSNYHINVVCDKGTQYDRRWQYFPSVSDSGSVPFILDVRTKDTTTSIASYTSSLITKKLTDPTTPVTRSLLVIGDSTGAWPLGELSTMFNSDTNYKLVLSGSNSGSIIDASGSSVPIKCECIPGWTINKFYSDTSTSWNTVGGNPRIGSPFVSASNFNMNYYTASYRVNLRSNDWVIFNLGINDVFSYTTDSSLFNAFQTIESNLESMISNVSSSIPNIRIGVSLIIPPNINQDAFGVNYGSGQTRNRYKRNRDLLIRRFINRYSNFSYSPNVYLLPLNTNLDTTYNFPSQSAYVNARNTISYIQASNGVHPEMPGYFQIADSYRMFLKNQG